MNDVAPTSLVIDSRKLSCLQIDGPALKVSMYERSPVLFPLRRLCRIHILGTPDSGMGALLLCAEQQIPVAFFDLRGHLRCRLLPTEGASSLVDHWFEHVEFDPKISKLYDDWVLHQGLYVMSQLGVNTGACQSRQKLLYEALRGICRRQLGKEKLKTALEWLDGLVRFHLDHMIESFGFLQQRGRRKLLEDLAPLLELHLLYALATTLQKHASFPVTPKSMTTFYQSEADKIEFASRRMLFQLVSQLEAIV